MTIKHGVQSLEAPTHGRALARRRVARGGGLGRVVPPSAVVPGLDPGTSRGWEIAGSSPAMTLGSVGDRRVEPGDDALCDGGAPGRALR